MRQLAVAMCAVMALGITSGQTPNLTHRYPFDVDARDTVSGADGQLIGGAVLSGGAVVLDGVSGYVNLPNNLVTGYNSISIETWVTDFGSSAWARIYDFGNSTGGEDFPLGSGTSGTQYMFLSSRSGSGTLRGSYTIAGGGSAEQVVEWPGNALPYGIRKHVVWTSDGSAQTAMLYVDGQPVGSNSFVTLTPAALGPTVNDWLGRSQWNDPLFNGAISEFRIYDGAITPLQIAVDVAAGPDRVIGDPGPVTSIALQASSPMSPGNVQWGGVFANFGSVTNVNLNWVPGITFLSSDTSVLSVDGLGHITAVGAGLASITAFYQGASNSRSIQVVDPPQTLVHRYSFAVDARDSEGTAHGSLAGGATIAAGAVVLNGVSAYVDLPNNLVTGLTSVSFEAWFNDSGSSGWARLWDFGNSAGGEGNQGGGTSYMFLSVPSGLGGVRGAYKPPSTGEQLVDVGARPSLGIKHHVVWTQDSGSQVAKLFLDGSLAGENDNFSDTPAGVGSTVNDWLGRSQYNDPYFYGSIDEFRIYDSALSGREVLQSYQLGPDLSAQSGPIVILTQPQSATVNEGQPMIFSVGYSGHRPVTCQWYQNGVSIPGATNASLRLDRPLPPDSGTLFQVRLTNVLTNVIFTAASSNASLFVMADTNPPSVLTAFNVGTSNVQIVFSEPVEAVTATNVASYSISNAVPILSASLRSDQVTVTLTTGPLVFGSNYVVRIAGVRDRAFVPNLVLPGTWVSFMAQPYTYVDIGGALPAGETTGVPGGYDLLAGGADIGGVSDQCGFSYQVVNGDFDIQARVGEFEGGDPWSKAGLVARETLDAGSRFAAALVCPGVLGGFFESRSATSAKAVRTGSFPCNLPNAWIRLQRAGGLFTGYASYDGLSWTVLGSASLALPNTLYVGMAAASHLNGSPSTAEFRDVGNTINRVVGSVPNPNEVLGPCSRRTPIVISEIMYKPGPRLDRLDLEYLELFNSDPWPHDIGGYQIGGSVQYTFSGTVVIPANGFVVVAAAPGDVAAVYGLTGVLGPYTNSLGTTGRLTLTDEAGALLLDLSYSDSAPWPMGADGTGHSIVLARPSYGEADPRAWERSDAPDGSPGRFEGYRPIPARNVVINEILAHTDPPDLDTIELYNHSNIPVDISGCSLSDDPGVAKFIIPSNTVIAARGFAYYTQVQLGFGLNAAGETIYFRGVGELRVLDALRFEAQENGVSFGRYPDGGPRWYRLAAKSFGSSNAPPLVSDVGINEIMYHPISNRDEDQYVELYNHGIATVDLSGWKFVSGVSFTIPTNIVLRPNSYLVIGRDVGRLFSNYPQLNLTNTIGNFGGRLSGAGERLALAKPDTIVGTNSSGALVTNRIDIIVDEVTYGTGGRWGSWSDGGGSSLELIDPRSDKRLAANWADSDESAKAPWTNIEATGVLDNGANFEAAIDFAQIGLLEAGECLVDNIEVRPGTNGANDVANSGFEGGLGDWSLLGDHSRSGVEPGSGYPNGGNALHLRTADRIWSGANGAQVVLTNASLTAGQIATLRFKARWLRGWPEVLLRLSGNWLEAAGRLAVPPNLGSPGLANSRLSQNAGPAIHEVVHSPSLPGVGQDVVVTACASDPDGIGSLSLRFRLDPAAAYTTVSMHDDGLSGDAVAGDGVYSATIPGQSAGAVVAFIVFATDSRGASSRFPAALADNAPERECVIVFGDPNSASMFGAYHFWLTQTNINRWVALPVLSNEEIDATLVYGNRVIYNAGGRYGGSPYHQSFDSPLGNNACHYIWSLPKDEMLLGAASFNKLHWPGNDIQDDNASQNINDATLQREQAANTFLRALGIPWVNRRYVAVYVNGHRRGALMEDALRPSVSAKDEYFAGDTGGLLYKFQPWFEFGASPSGNYMPWANEAWSLLMPYTTTGGAFKTARYRWNYELRETPDSLNNYTNLYSLVTAASSGTRSNYVSALKNLADMENWMRLVAANHAAGNWDCWGVMNGQNIYGWVSPQRRWTLMMFDFSIVLGNRISWGPGQNLLALNGDDANWQQIYNTPEFMRMYWRALKELVNGAMMASNMNPVLEAKYAAFVADGLSVQGPGDIETWVAQARASISSQIAAVDSLTFGLGATNLTASKNSVVLSGWAPLEVSTISVNGELFSPTWNSLTGWTLTVPAPAGLTNWLVSALDRLGHAAGGSVRVTVTNPGVPDAASGSIVVNEIMPQAHLSGAEYVELYNRSTNTTFDLSGWRLNGLAYTFPPGSLIAPQSYLTLARSRVTFAAAYGAMVPVFDEFGGTLQPDGETLSLLQPGAAYGSDVVVDRIRFETNAPWPSAGSSFQDTSLQVVDSSLDNSRVGNWACGQANPATSPQWVYIWTNVTATSSRLYVYLQSAGDIYLDDIKLVAGQVPEAGADLLINGGFESPLGTAWNLTPNFSQSTLSSAMRHTGIGSLHLVATAAGSGSNNAVYQDMLPALTNGAPYTLSFWYFQSTNGGPLVLRLSGGTNTPTLDPTPAAPLAAAASTPSAANSVRAGLTAFPSIWLNETQPVNLTGPVDNFGERDPWIELVNSGSTPINLGGLYLGTNYSSPTLWAFPPYATILPGQFLIVWADGQPQQSTGSVLHTNFRLAPGSGSVALSRFLSNSLQIVDYLNYSALPDNYSYGDVPDGQPFYRESMFRATPAGTNNASLPPIAVIINEWMAENTGYLLDPGTGKYDDWFELYNSADSSADLAGYYLTDNLTNQLQYRIPAGYQVPAHGFLLVWADAQPSANGTNGGALHVNFKLDKAGEAIGLFAPDGTAIDAVAFGAQTANVSEGRYPDGGNLRLFMPVPSPWAPNIVPPAEYPPTISSFGLLAGNQLSLSFRTAAGHTYRVECKDDLSSLSWVTLGSDLFATGSLLTVFDSPGAGAQRFYRVIMVR